ncbi:hypothetical protein INT44_007553 [Umbelopsis vinacea]|uniref:alpha-galactosidase n=1 Tax=Umbelopsis vinacea TaxID=44442 RepID=A0A8H7PJW1_9FUNG|nr:hypothetical protein INT44_007553 [Umbelopsis vinacea]
MLSDLARISPLSFNLSSPVIHLDYTALSDPQAKRQAYLSSNQDPRVTVENSFREVENGYELTLELCTMVDVELHTLKATYWADLTDIRMLANGFQSWSQTRELNEYGRLSKIPYPVAWITKFDLQGDYDFYNYTGDTGNIFSSTVTHLRFPDDQFLFVGSVSEETGYTYLEGNFNDNSFAIYKDIEGKHLKANDKLVIKCFISQGYDLPGMWRSYARYYTQGELLGPPVTGWTSWYNYYEAVTEKDIMDNLEAMQAQSYPIDYFQIDDGYQQMIGDWLDINDKFPSGMAAIADRIKSAGYTPGLWLAPFSAQYKSAVVAAHPEWVLRKPDNQSEYLVAGPNWGGFYALDIYNQEFRDHLKHVFDTVLNTWGFGLVKLDFLFAAAMVPRLGKTRGEIMWDAITLLQEIVGDKIILGSGVPLASAWGRVAYCRVGSDVSPWWEDSKLKFFNVRERVSTASSLLSTLNRWGMGNMFGNDPDAILLRTQGNKLTSDERYTLCVLNNVLGHLVFTSDNVSQYGEKEHLLYAGTFPKVNAVIQSVKEIEDEVYRVEYVVPSVQAPGTRYTTYVNMAPIPRWVHMQTRDQPTTFFESVSPLDPIEAFVWPSGAKLMLRSHQTRTFFESSSNNQSVTLIGSQGHIIPAAEIQHWEMDGHNVKVTFNERRRAKSTLYFRVPATLDTPVTVNSLTTITETIKCGNDSIIVATIVV